MKVGILSMQRCMNWGSYLQAWGLKHLIERECNCQVEFVDIEGEDWEERIELSPLVPVKRLYHKWMYQLSPEKNAIHFEPYKMNENLMNGQKMINGLLEKHWAILGLANEARTDLECDVLVIGSDEMFNCTMPRYLDRHLCLFGLNVHCKKKISYAASFGDTTIEKIKHNGFIDDVGEALRSFNQLSVRDQNSYNIVQNLTGIAPVFNLDPVLMYEFPEVNSIKVRHKNYIAVYGYGNNINDPEIISELKKFAKDRGLKLLAIGNGQDFCDETVAFSPFEVLAYMKNATYSVTNTFHGTIFSLKYEIPFAVMVRGMNQNKLGDLVRRFNVTDRVVDDAKKIGKILLNPLDDIFIQNKILENRKITCQYLKDNIVGV